MLNNFLLGLLESSAAFKMYISWSNRGKLTKLGPQDHILSSENDDYIDGHKGLCLYDCWVNNKASVGVLVSFLCVGLLMWFDKCVELEDAWDNWHNHHRSLGGCLEHLP